jgi:hypothetical protein
MIFEGPSGRMGTPDNLEEYVRLDADDLTIYVARPLLEKLALGAKQMLFYIDGYGRHVLVFDEPWRGEV